MSDALLKSIYERWERLEADKRTIQEELKELFAEAKGHGFDGKAIRAAFRKVANLTGDRAAQTEEHEALVDLYVTSLTRAHPHVAREATQSASERIETASSLPSPDSIASGSTPAGSVSDKIPATHSEDDDIPAFIKAGFAKPLRPHCQNPDLCASGTPDHCHRCTKAMESEAA